MRYLWMPRLVERIHAAAAGTTTPQIPLHYTPENSSAAASSDSFGTPLSDLNDCYNNYPVNNQDYYPANNNQLSYGDQSLTSPTGLLFNQGLEFTEQNSPWMDGGDVPTDNLWNVDDVWFLQHHFNTNA